MAGASSLFVSGGGSMYIIVFCIFMYITIVIDAAAAVNGRINNDDVEFQIAGQRRHKKKIIIK